MKIAIDFDGTCVTHEFPKVGKDIGAARILRELVSKGNKLILYTMRSDGQESGNTLSEAVEWFNKNCIELYSVQKDKNQENWTSSNKCYAQLYIDDAALGIPLLYQEFYSDKPFVDWNKVEILLKEKGIL